MWKPNSWRSKHVSQPVDYPNSIETQRVIERISKLPPLTTPEEIERLRKSLSDVSNQKAFVLTAGDCSESFDYCQQNSIEAKLKLILMMSLILVFVGKTPVVRLLRGAGQFAKPRSSPTEIVDGVEVLSYRGDNINGIDINDRTPDPKRLIEGYFHSAATLNYIRGLLDSSFADVHDPKMWSIAHVRDSRLQSEYDKVLKSLGEALDFMNVVGMDKNESGGRLLGTIDLYTSHEGLVLDYEEAMTRLMSVPSKDKRNTHVNDRQAYYNTSASFIWIGDRTRQLDGAHVEYFRGIRNPIGVKIGPSMTSDELKRILKILDPDQEAGRIILISRYGCNKVEKYLPEHIEAVGDHPVIWQCDPMHGNTVKSTSKPELKTRSFTSIMEEVRKSIEIHARYNKKLGGVHLELTGDVTEDGFSVTECIGGSMELLDEHLNTNYQTNCDPRLNLEQSLDVAFMLSNMLKNVHNEN